MNSSLQYVQFGVVMENDFVYALEFLTPRKVIGKCRQAWNNAFKSILFDNYNAENDLSPLWLTLCNSREISVGEYLLEFFCCCFCACLFLYLAHLVISLSYLMIWSSHEKLAELMINPIRLYIRYLAKNFL